MIMEYLIATHSYMASGLRNAVEVLSGKKQKIAVINAYIDSDNFETELEKTLQTIQSQNIIVLTDLLSGSVNQALMRYKGDKRLYLAAGVNLPFALALLETDAEADPEARLRSCVKQAREQMVFEKI